MALLGGIAYKLTSVLVILSALGWLLFVTGFGLQKLKGCHEYPRDVPNWITAFLGPVLFAWGLAHSTAGWRGWKWLRIFSALIVSCLGIVYLVADGYVVNERISDVHQAYSDYSRKKTDSLDVPTWTVLQLAGGLVSWVFCVVQLIVWPCFVHLCATPTMLPAQPEEAEGLDLFAGGARKLAVPCIIFSGVAWLKLLVGTALLDAHNSHVLLASEDPFAFSYWAALLVGPLMYVTALTHAALPQKQASVIVGALAALLSMLYITSLGYILSQSGAHMDHTHYDIDLRLQFYGGVISGLFWAITVTLWPYYCNDTRGGSTYGDSCKAELLEVSVIPPFKGFARKLALVSTMLSFCGWLPLVIGLGEGLDDLQYLEYIYWVTFIIGPVMYIIAFMHIALPPSHSNTTGALAGFVSVVYFASIGVVLHATGGTVQEAKLFDLDVPGWVSLQFASSLVSCVFWGVAFACWPAFT